MIDLEKEIPKIVIKKRVFDNVLIIGRGNWARFYLDVLQNSFFRIKKIYIYSKNHKKKIFSNNLVQIETDIKKIKKLSRNIIIANRNKDHLKFLKIFSNKKYNVLVEKPIVNSTEEYEYILDKIKYHKLNFFVGFQRYYAIYFHHFKNLYLKKNKPKKIEFIWYANENKSKNSNKFLINILYHIISILFIFLKVRKIKLIKKSKKFIIFNYGDCKIKVIFSNSHNKNLRKIYFYFNKKLKLIDWTEEKKVFYKFADKKIVFKTKFSIYNLQYQLYYFLNSHKVDNKKIANTAYNLRYFIDFIKNIH